MLPDLAFDAQRCVVCERVRLVYLPILLSLDNIWNGTAEDAQPAPASPFFLAINVACFIAYHRHECRYCGARPPWLVCPERSPVCAAVQGPRGMGHGPRGQLNAMMKQWRLFLSNAVLIYQVTGREIGPKFGQSFAVMIANLLDQLFVSKGFEALEADLSPTSGHPGQRRRLPSHDRALKHYLLLLRVLFMRCENAFGFRAERVREVFRESCRMQQPHFLSLARLRALYARVRHNALRKRQIMTDVMPTGGVWWADRARGCRTAGLVRSQRNFLLETIKMSPTVQASSNSVSDQKTNAGREPRSTLLAVG